MAARRHQLPSNLHGNQFRSMAQGIPQWIPRVFHGVPRAVPRGPPRGPSRGPKGPQGIPKCSFRVPKGTQNVPECLKAPKGSPRGLQASQDFRILLLLHAIVRVSRNLYYAVFTIVKNFRPVNLNIFMILFNLTTCEFRNLYYAVLTIVKNV